LYLRLNYINDIAIFLQAGEAVELTLNVLLIVLVVLLIVVIGFIGALMLSLYYRANRVVRKFDRLVNEITQIPKELRMAGLFSGLGASLYGFMNGVKSRFSGSDSDKDGD